MVGSDWRKILGALRVPVCPACRGSGFDLKGATYVYDKDGWIMSATFPPCFNCWGWK